MPTKKGYGKETIAKNIKTEMKSGNIVTGKQIGRAHV